MTTAFYDGKDPLNLKCGETGHVLVRIDSATKDVGISALIQSGHVTTDQPAKTTDEGGNVIFDVICPAAGGDCPTSSSILFYPTKGGKGVSVEVVCAKATTSTTVSLTAPQRLVLVVDDVREKLAYLRGQLEFG